LAEIADAPEGAGEPQEWTVEGFLDEFMRIDADMEDRSFLFVLGAGASVSSDIPAAGSLARTWVAELHRLCVGESGPSLEEWATPENLDIDGFSLDRVAEFYPRIYDRRFGEDPDRGYAYLEKVMGDAEPDIGYSVLAQILAKTRHRVVITTNFDNLVADGLSLYAETFPLVCGHESLTGFVRTKLRRPLVAKIHRDLLLGPKTAPADTASLDERWASVLRRLLRENTPLVIGYGGNDGSLMGFLESLEPGDLLGGVYWCYRVVDGKPPKHIRSFVDRHRGKLVAIVGFDEFMLQLSDRFGWPPLTEQMQTKSQRRIKHYRDRLQEFSKKLRQAAAQKKLSEDEEAVLRAFDETVSREESWWNWVMRAQAAADPERQEDIYRQGLMQFPGSPELLGSFALLLHEERKAYDEAERLYREALELDPEDATNTRNYATFVEQVRKDYDEAERLYRKALELGPESATNTGSYAIFMEQVRKDYDEAERLYRKALELDPENATNTGNYAIFVEQVRKDYDEAERLYRKALELDPEDAYNTGNSAGFLIEIGRFDDALKPLRLAWKLNEGETNQLSAELLLYWCLLASRKEQDCRAGLARLKFLLTAGYVQLVWTFEGVLKATTGSLEEEDQEFYSDLAAAILDPDEVSQLEKFERWAEIEPVDPAEPWDMKV